MNEQTNYGGKKDLYMVKKGNGYKRFEDVVLLDGEKGCLLFHKPKIVSSANYRSI